jgi:hypothetical protein
MKTLNRTMKIFAPAASFLRLSSLVGCLLGIASAAFAQVTVSVTDTTGWNPWIKADGTWMTDPAADQQTGQGQDDFVGSTTVAGFLQKAGSLAGTQSYVFRARMDKYDSKGFRGNWINGMDLDGDGDLDLFMRLSDTSGGTSVAFALPGTGLNISPSTTTIGSWQGATTLTASTYNYQQVTADQFNGTADAYVTFAISFANLQTAIQTYAGSAFSTFQVNDNTRISFIASTSTQGNALNQDIYGTAGNTSSTLTWAQLGASTGMTTPLGIIPEPATYAQVGFLLLTGGVVAWRQRRNARAQASA